MNSFKRLFKISASKRIALIHALITLVVCRFFLSLIGLNRMLPLLKRLRPNESKISTVEISWALGVWVRRIPKMTCLVQALAGQALLRRSGETSRLCIGVKTNDEFKAHAWLLSEKDIVLGEVPELSEYQLVFSSEFFTGGRNENGPAFASESEAPTEGPIS